MSKNVFIFVVCGAKEHIDTLHFSLEYLKKHSKSEIWVLTDASRNEVPVQHNNIIDVQTPEAFDHHQASIYLKTGIHHYFPKGNRYCYLDTDIIALSEEVDKIFDAYIAPITFAPDHCRMSQFSPYALKCGCLEENQHFLKLLNDKMDELDPYRKSEVQEIKEARREWQSVYSTINSRWSSKIRFGLKYVLSRGKFRLSPEIYCDRREKIWIKNDKTVFMKQINLHKLCKELGLKWSFIRMEPITPSGKKLWSIVECNHLREAVHKKFGTPKPQVNFQHWNGGVFLFDDQSHDFLETWFQSTMDIFKDPYWKTRDQGTLIKTVWESGLQKHPTLAIKWNAIADYHNPFLKWMDKKSVRLNSQDITTPVLLHVYHHFGDETWDFWNQIPKV